MLKTWRGNQVETAALLAISRTQVSADAAMLTGPRQLANALQWLKSAARQIPMGPSPSFKPFKDYQSFLRSVFRQII